MSCVDVRNSSRVAMLSLKGRVDFTCLNCVSQTHFASAVEHGLVFCISLRHALSWCCRALALLRKCALASRTHVSFFPSDDVVMVSVHTLSTCD